MIDTTDLLIGTSEPAWLARTTDPLFIPHHRLARLVTKLPVSPPGGRWVLDSGGYNHVRKHGGWVISAHEYAAAVLTYAERIGNLSWAAPQDWMCEADALAATGLSVLEHQRRTVANAGELARAWRELTDRPSPWRWVLQGDPRDDRPVDYAVGTWLRCWEMYADAGIDLLEQPLIGLGSVCRQQHTERIGAVVDALQDRHPQRQLPLHGFGCKQKALELYGEGLASADSQAWSLHARYHKVKLSTCTHRAQTCSYCLDYARLWRQRVLDKLEQRPSCLPLIWGDTVCL